MPDAISSICDLGMVRGHSFHNMNPQVHSQSLSQGYTKDILNIKSNTKDIHDLVVRPQQVCSCHLRPRGGQPQKRANLSCGADDIQVHLVFYSTIEPVDLPRRGPLEAAGVQKLYEP